MNTLDLRAQSFESLAKHALRAREIASLNTKELDYIRELIESSEELSINEYCHLLNRLSVDDKRVRKSKRLIVWGCLIEAATIERLQLKKLTPA